MLFLFGRVRSSGLEKRTSDARHRLAYAWAGKSRRMPPANKEVQMVPEYKIKEISYLSSSTLDPALPIPLRREGESSLLSLSILMNQFRDLAKNVVK